MDWINKNRYLVLQLSCGDTGLVGWTNKCAVTCGGPLIHVWWHLIRALQWGKHIAAAPDKQGLKMAKKKQTLEKLISFIIIYQQASTIIWSFLERVILTRAALCNIASKEGRFCLFCEKLAMLHGLGYGFLGWCVSQCQSHLISRIHQK